ncbi:MAG: peptidylprolyl isomerase [Spirochaetia bacterium]|jgi:parvulin-like peptidyl-prolyl isomerase|nr:peptidylprolyl isomerase [Spirochaetia bacterium]
MKKIFFSVTMLLLASGFVFSQDIIDQRAATVNLTKPEIISKKQLTQTVELLKQNGIDKSDMEVLDTMIGDVLLKQGAEREKIRVNDSEVINAVRKQIGNAASSMTDQQLKDLVRRQTGVTWERYAEKSKATIELQKLVQKVKSEKMSNIPDPTETEIKKFYDENSRQFFIAKMALFDHIFVDIRMLSTKEENDRARERALEYAKQINNGSKTFDQIVESSDDTSSKYNKGNFGYLRIDDLQRKKLLGDDFFDSVFNMKKGQISGVIKSNMGFHIIRMNEVYEPRILDIDDRINPESETTVRQRIETYLIIKKQEELFKESVEELVDELRKDAEIKYYL